MNHPAVRVLVALCFSAGAIPALAQSAGDFGIGVGVSTLGPTVEGTYRINSTFGVRVPVGYLSVDFDDSSDGIDYEVDADLGGIGLLGDYFTGLGGLRLSAGALYSGYSVDGRGQGDGAVGDTDYTNVDLRFDAEPENRVLPVASVGYDAYLGARWMISADLGATYTGGYDISLVDQSGQVSQEDIDAEIGDIDSDLPEFLPYVKLTVGFRF